MPTADRVRARVFSRRVAGGLALVMGVAVAVGSATTLQAQQTSPNDPRTALGLAVSASGGSRDTLGLLVVAVTPESPADRAGVTEGSRIAAVNGVSLRLALSEVGQPSSGDAAVRRLEQELQSSRPGAPVVLQVFGGGRRQTVTVPTDGTAATSTPLPSPAVTPVPLAAAERTPAVATTATPPATPTVTPSVAPAPADARPVVDSAHAANLAAVIERMGELQQQLHRLALDQHTTAVADTLSDAEEDLSALRRRLRVAEALFARADSTRADSTRNGGLPGLRFAAVNDDLAAYFGEGSARGLLIVQADATWDPIRSGDVVVRVDGAPANPERLRAAFATQRQSTIELLRRRRLLTVTRHAHTGE